MLSGVHRNNPRAVVVRKTSQGRQCPRRAIPVEERSPQQPSLLRHPRPLDLQRPWFMGFGSGPRQGRSSRWAKRRQLEELTDMSSHQSARVYKGEERTTWHSAPEQGLSSLNKRGSESSLCHALCVAVENELPRSKLQVPPL